MISKHFKAIQNTLNDFSHIIENYILNIHTPKGIAESSEPNLKQVLCGIEKNIMDGY